MRRCLLTFVVLTTAAGLLGGCETVKSSNPTSPSVAGPIPGVTITTPKNLEPGANWTISSVNQPVTLLLENASSNGQRPLTYLFEVASDVNFTAKVFSRDGVEPGTNGRTSLRLPDALASDRTYYWRARAGDGANASNYSAASAFSIQTPAVIGAPQPVSPVEGVRISGVRPEFVIRNATKSGPVGQVSYVFEISTNESFTAIVAVLTVPETAIETRFTPTLDLPYDLRVFWRVRAFDSQTVSPWSLTQLFLTATAPPPPPPPPTTPAPSPTPTSGWPKTGPEVVAWAERNYANRLLPVGSLSERQANMAFVRDRMIEAGICGGMDLAWNLKRGGPELSIDFLVHRVNGQDIGVDIGMDYDNHVTPLQLYWGSGAPFPFYGGYSPRPTCK